MIFPKQFRTVLFAFACVSLMALAQEQDPAPHPAPTPAATPATEKPASDQDVLGKRVFGVLPNYRTANESALYAPITVKQKFIIGAKDSFDYPLVLLAGGLAAMGQLTGQNPSFGQGMAGFGRRLGTAYADQAIGNMMTESFFPSFLHEDPRYFRRGRGSKWSRVGYALTRILVTRTDSGGTRFNFSEVAGNAAAVAISNSYYPDNRTPGEAATKLGEQLATDAVSQVLKEFWPDIRRKLFHRGEDTDLPAH